MLSTLLIPLLVLGSAEPEGALPGLNLKPGGMFRDPPLEVWLSKTDRLERGDRVRVYAKADLDGYLLVLHAEPGGRIRVLFPLDPLDDHYVRAGETYEALGRADRAAFQVMESAGSGAVFAAFSRDPFRFDQLVRGDHWDYTLGTWAIGEDAEGDLVRLAELMAAGAAYEYDLVRYEVNRYVAHGRYGRRLGLYVGSYHGRSWFGVSWGDPYYYSSWYYDPYYYDYYYYRPYRYVYYEPYFPFWYDPCWYAPCFYRTHYYGYGPRFYYGYYYSRSYYRDHYWGGRWDRYDGGRYAFKGGLSPRGIEPRSRAPLASAVTRRLLSPEDARTGSLGRRTLAGNTAPQSATSPGRRVMPQQGPGTPSRAAPAATTTRRTAEPVRQGSGTTRTPVRTAAPTQPERRQPEADAGRREVQDPRRVTPETRQRVPERQAEPRRGGELNRRELTNRMAQPQQPQAQPPRETTRPRLERREPPRQPEPRAAPRAEPRSAPPPRAEPRSAPPPRAEPRSAPPPRAEPRSAPAPRAAPRSAPPSRAAPRSAPPARAAPAPRRGRPPE